jgi:cyclopropane fatty-acyl-phospholipid synthase-like methyltransferase
MIICLLKARLILKVLKNKAKQEVEFLVTSLNLPKGSAILDVPCGTGRHSKILAEHGYNVTGLDISAACIDIAIKSSKIPGVEYKLGNMQNLSSYSNKFDCTLNLFSSFGYFSNDTENEADQPGVFIPIPRLDLHGNDLTGLNQSSF